MSEFAPSVATEQTAPQSAAQLGFWLYLMTDCLLFASLFASFVVLRGQTAGGVSGAAIFSLSFVFIETLILLTSSLTAGLALVTARNGRPRLSLVLLAATALLGASFLAMEISEFHALVAEGHSWTHSAFLSSYFGLVGTHGLHITVGLVWLLASMVYIWRRGMTVRQMQRLTMWTMFWHFLDIVWIGIFTIVYLVGVV